MAGHQYVVSGGASWQCSFPQNWPDVSGTPDMVEKALLVIGEILEKSSGLGAVGAVGAVDWVFLSALRAKTETALHDAAVM